MNEKTAPRTELADSDLGAVDTEARSLSAYVGLLVRGLAMGAADVVPGVSGGTIAFISGIYDELIDSLRRCDLVALRLLLSLRIKDAWQHVNANFLAAVFSGVLISILSLAKAVTYLLDTAPILVWSFFFGLILSAGLYIGRQIPKWNWQRLALLLLGLALALTISDLKPTQLPETWWVLMAAGAIAVCAMILPGISGGFLLLVMGLYQSVIGAVVEFNIVFLASLGAGCILGLLLFSHLLHWLLDRYHAATMALLTGFLLGSLNVVWPWKEVVTTVQNRHGEWVPLVQNNVLPLQYSALTGVDSLLGGALICAVSGLLLVGVLEWRARVSTVELGK